MRRHERVPLQLLRHVLILIGVDSFVGVELSLLFSELWSHITFWTVVGCAIVYCCAGIIGVRALNSKHLLSIAIPIVSASIGALLGFFSGAIACTI